MRIGAGSKGKAMIVITTIEEMRSAIRSARKEGISVGFVPTMGSLHEGHVSLVRRSAAENGLTVVSIFVNPTQFNDAADLEKYPRNIESDSEAAGKAGASILFVPPVREIYPDGFDTSVIVGHVTETLCGAGRPGHFRGVAVVVLKLFNIIAPDTAYFGNKDAQQVAVVKKMVKDLNVDVRIVACPIVREEDGLAMSSRNVFLSKEQRRQAAVLPESLELARAMAASGVIDARAVIDAVAAKIREKELAEIEYIDIVDADTMQSASSIENGSLLAVAVRFGDTRLIDNAILEVYN